MYIYIEYKQNEIQLLHDYNRDISDEYYQKLYLEANIWRKYGIVY